MNIIGRKNIYFAISLIVLIPGIVSLLLYGLTPAIDFTGGSNLEVQVNTNSSNTAREIAETVRKEKVHVYAVKQADKSSYIIRTVPLDPKTKNKIVDNLKKKFGNIKEKSFDTVGASIGGETTANAVKAVLIASLVITLFIAYSFRAVSKPVASWKFGVSAIVALLHDVLLVLGIFSLLGKFAGVEVDSLFITAVLTVMGFSVHDTIVVFDRIRENLKKSVNTPFEQVVNNSVIETLNRSLNTSFTVILVLLALLLFGGESIRWFVVALLVGIVSGTYSSIFNASPLLVLWYEWDKRRNKRK